MQHNLLPLIDPHGSNQHDAGLVGASIPAIQHLGEGVQGIPGVDRPQELHMVVAEVGYRLFGIVLHTEGQGDVEHHLRACRQIGKAVGPGVVGIQVEWVGLHKGARKTRHIGPVEAITARVYEHLAGAALVQVATVLRLANPVQLNGDVRGDLLLLRQAY